MSRCFPFPPPGYERKARAENLDLLTKEKHISKKDKKEKREREKKEGKERKHKDRSKEKHGEKKDWKEDKGRDKKKDKEKKKDKNRSKDKASISNEKILERSGTNGGGKNGEHTQKAVESNDSKFTEELGRRIRDTEKGAGKNHVVENAAAKLQGSYDSARLEKARGTDGQMANCIISSQKRPGDIPDQRILGSHISGNHLVTEPSRCVSHENDAYRKHESKKAIDPQQRVIPNHIISSAITTQKNGSGTSVLQEDAIKKLEGKEKTSDLQQRAIDNHTGSNTIAIVQSGTGVLQKKDGSKKTEDKEKTNNKKTGTQKGDKCKDRDREKRKDRKEKHKDKEKKKENDKMKEKGDHKDKGQKHVSDPVKEQNQLNTKPVLVFRDAEKHASFEGKPKRKEINGFLQESELRPNKLPRVAPSSNPPLENGKILDFNHIVMPCTSERHGAVTTSSHSDKLDGAVDNVKVERILDNKEQKVNGELHSQTPSTTLKPLVTNAGQIVDSTKKPPHPDSKYLSQILSVPEMDELPEFDDQDWLFRCDNMHQKPKMKLEADDMPQVWAKALKIESSDVLVLPYVIPY